MFDKNIFINEKISKKNSEIMDMYFTLNKKLDNLMDYIDIICVMPKFSEGLHKIAHLSPIDADRFRDYNALYSFRTQYNAIEGQYKDFESPIEGIENIIEYLLDIENALAEAKLIAKSEENYDYNCFINKEIEAFRLYKKQFILLHDKLKQYRIQGDSLQDFDNRCEDFFVIG